MQKKPIVSTGRQCRSGFATLVLISCSSLAVAGIIAANTSIDGTATVTRLNTAAMLAGTITWNNLAIKGPGVTSEGRNTATCDSIGVAIYASTESHSEAPHGS